MVAMAGYEMTIHNRSTEEWLAIVDRMPDPGPSIRGANFLDTPKKEWEKVGFPTGNERVVDIGCGHGRMALACCNTEVEYFGLDVIPEMIDWATNAFRPWPNIHFIDLGIMNGRYNPAVGHAAETLILPFPAASVDIVLAISLFTHLERWSAAAHYLKQIRRIMKPGGRLLSTWFLSPPNPNVYYFADRTVFKSNSAYLMLRDLGFENILETGGTTDSWHDQREIVSRLTYV